MLNRQLPRRASLACAAFLTASFLPALAFATTYYVSPTGNDANNGTTAGTAWQSVAKVNSTALQPGDSVLFQRNGQWRESLTAPTSGASGNPITFADYGDGAKPKFWGSTVLNNALFQAAGNGIYVYPAFGAPVYSVLANQSFFNYSFGQIATNVVHAWSYDGAWITLNSPDSDPRSDGRLYTAVLRDNVIYSNGQSHLVFRNLIADESARYDDNGGYGVRIENSTDVLVTDCEAYHAGKHNFGVINSTAFIGRDLVAAYAAPGQSSSGGASAYVSYGDTSTGTYNQTSEWHNITATNMDDPQDNTVYEAFTDHGATVGSLLVDDLQSTGAAVTISNADNTAGTVKMTGGKIQNARLEVGGTGLVVDGVELSGAQATIDVTGSNALLQNLLVHGTNLGGNWYQTAILIRGTNDILRFSTVEMDPNAGSNTAVALTSANLAFQMYGNALLAPYRAFALWDSGLGLGTLAYAGFNFYLPGTTYAQYNGGVFQWQDLPLTQLQALGLDGGSIQGDPGFTDEANDNYRPRAGSPLIDAAHLTSGLSTIPTDIAGDPRPQGAAYDIGAYEGASAVAVTTPTTTTTPVTTTTPTTTTPAATTTSPLTLLTPASGATVSGTIVATAMVTVTLDPAGSQLMVDGQFVSDHRVSGAPYVYPLDTTQLTNGTHTVLLWGHDISNRNLLSNSVTINVAN